MVLGAGTIKELVGEELLVDLIRCLCNGDWLSLMSESYYEYLSQSTSDHSPMLLHLLSKSNSRPKPFKFF